MKKPDHHPIERAPKGVRTDKPIGLRLKPDELAKVQKYAAREHCTTAAFARRAVLRGIADYELDSSSLST